MKLPRLSVPNTQTLFKHLLIHTGIYYALTGRRAGSGPKATRTEVWTWLMRVFRAEHPEQYQTLLHRQQAYIDWEKSGGKYTSAHKDALDQAFVNLYSSVMQEKALLTEQEIDAFVEALGLQNIKFLLEQFRERYLQEYELPENTLKEMFVVLAELEQDEFDLTVQLVTEKGRGQYIQSFAQSFAQRSTGLLGNSYRQLGDFLWETTQGTAEVSKDLFEYANKVTRELFTHLTNEAQTAKTKTQQQIPSKRSVVQKSKSARKALFGKRARNA